jgi:hypothetical protein
MRTCVDYAQFFFDGRAFIALFSFSANDTSYRQWAMLARVR